MNRWTDSIRKLLGQAPRRGRKRYPITKPLSKLNLEPLEGREVPATLTVNTTLDDTNPDAALTLREAVELVNNGGNAMAAFGRALTAGELAQVDTTNPFGTSDTVAFDGALAGQQVGLSLIGDDILGFSGLAITSPVTIDGTATPGLSIGIGAGAEGPMRLFIVIDSSLTLQGLTLTGGVARGGNGGAGDGGGGGGGGMGGAVFVDGGTLVVRESLITGNQAIGGNGGIAGGYFLGGGGGGMGQDGGDGSYYGAGYGGGYFGGYPGGYGGPGGGGGGGYSGESPYAYGGAGGFGGGGGAGGGYQSEVGPLNGNGGAGGFGGGGGGGGYYAGQGGAGGFGGGDGNSAGDGSYGDGGGGAGLGGGIFNNGGTVTITNSTLTGNSAAGGTGANDGSGLGGGVFNRNGTVTLLNSTLSGNVAADGGRNVFNLGDGDASTATAVINNSILGQADDTITDFDSATINAGAVASSGVGNLVRNPGTFAGTVVSTADPLLGALADNGGPTQTMLPGSPAFDAGDNAAAAGLTTDQRGAGFPRVVNGVVDIGAVEADDTTGPAVTISPPSVPVTVSGPVTYTVTYTDTNFFASTLGVADVTLNATGTASGTITSVTGTGNTRLVTISNITGNGTLSISIAAGTASDTLGNLSPAAGPSAPFTVAAPLRFDFNTSPVASPPGWSNVQPSTTYTAGNFGWRPGSTEIRSSTSTAPAGTNLNMVTVYTDNHTSRITNTFQVFVGAFQGVSVRLFVQPSFKGMRVATEGGGAATLGVNQTVMTLNGNAGADGILDITFARGTAAWWLVCGIEVTFTEGGQGG